jgi:CubicO group peptidase (beta-lactamase class C family)
MTRSVLWILILSFVCSAGWAQAPAAPVPLETDLQAIDTLVADAVKARDLVGVSLAIMRDGKVVLAKGYGKGSLATGKAVDPETMFAIGSVTKQFTCACVMLLAADGRLALEDKVAKYYPNAARASDISLLDLMRHVSGYPDYYPLDFVDRRMFRPIAIDELIRQYAALPLDFEPRTRWSYSNTGFVILGRVIERASGMPYEAFLTRRILQPLKMSHTAFAPREDDSRLAEGTASFAFAPPQHTAPEAAGWIFSAGALYASASDLLTWDLALMDGRVVQPDAYRLMTTPGTLADGKLTSYGCGLSLARHQGHPILTHGGAVSGFAATNTLIPESKSAVVLLLNNEDYFSMGDIHGKILDRLLPKLPPPTEEKDPPPARPNRPAPPKISGLAAADAAKQFFLELQSGKIDRSQLGEEFSFFLNDPKAASAAKRLEAFGELTKTAVVGLSERGGMEVATVRLTLKNAVLKALMYRSTDGKIQEYLLYKD